MQQHQRLLVEQLVKAATDDQVPTELLENEQRLREVLGIVQESCAAQEQNGKDMLEQMAGMESIRFVPCGYREIDDMLEGGIREGQVTELYGASGSGKTQICLTAAAMTVSRGEGVVYMDTGNSFSARRVGEMLRRLGLMDGASLDAALEKLLVVPVFDVSSLVTGLQDVVRKCTRKTMTKPTMIIIDSIGTMLAPLLGGISFDVGHEIMHGLGLYLKGIAWNLNAAVIITNHTVGSGHGGTGLGPEFTFKKSALGEAWCSQAHTRVELLVSNQDPTNSNATAGISAHDPHRVMRRAYLHASTMVSSGRCVQFRV